MEDILTYLAGAASTGLVWTLHEIRRQRRLNMEDANHTIDEIVDEFQEFLYRERGVPTDPLVRKIFLGNESRREAAKQTLAQEELIAAEYQDDIAFGGLMDEIDMADGQSLAVTKQGTGSLAFNRLNRNISTITDKIVTYIKPKIKPAVNAYDRTVAGVASLSTRVLSAVKKNITSIKARVTKQYEDPDFRCLFQVIDDNLNGRTDKYMDLIGMYNKVLPASRTCADQYRDTARPIVVQLETRLGELIADETRDISGYVANGWPAGFDPLTLSKIFRASFANHKYGNDSPAYYVHKLMTREQL